MSEGSFECAWTARLLIILYLNRSVDVRISVRADVYFQTQSLHSIVGYVIAPSVLDISSLYGLFITLCPSWSSDVQPFGRADVQLQAQSSNARTRRAFKRSAHTHHCRAYFPPGHPHPLACAGVSVKMKSSSYVPYSLHTCTQGGDHRVGVFDFGAGRCYSIHLPSP